MPGHGDDVGRHVPGLVDNAISSLNAWFGDYLSQTGNELQQPMAFYRDNRPLTPEDIVVPTTGKVCVLVHGLGCNESLWNFPAPDEDDDYGGLLERRRGYMPLYLRFNTGLRVCDNGRELAGLLERFCDHHGAAVSQLLLIGHSMGGLVLRSACHVAGEAGQQWVSRVRHVVYLGTPHLGAPLEKAATLTANVLGFFDTTATRVIRDVLESRSAGVKDLRDGTLVEPVPWLATARHHFVVGEALPGVEALGDLMVRQESAAGRASGAQPGAPGESAVQVMPGLAHLALARHPAVYEHLERWVNSDEQ